MIKEKRKKLHRLRAIRHIQQKNRLKRWIKPLSIMAIIGTVLSSCVWLLGNMGDPLINITFLNHTNASVSIKIEPISPDTHFSFRGETTPSANENFIDLTPPKRESSLYFGMGYWSDIEIQTISQQIHKLTITTADKTLIYNKPEQVEKLLKTNWKKTGSKNSIYINIDSNF